MRKPVFVGKATKKPKFGNKKVVIDNVTFDSTKEGKRYLELKILQRAGKISGLKLQQKFPIVVNGMKVCDYVADFSYHDCETHEDVVEDVKSEITRINRAYRLKVKLMKAVHGIAITEI